MLRHETGVLAATTAFGKTVVAAWLIAQRGVNTLVLVHRRQLLDQWVDRLATFLGLPAKSIGRIGGGRSRPTGRIDVAVIQSLARKGVVDDRVAEYGHVIVDECHHLSAHSFEQVVHQAKARFVVGLSATVARKDGHHPIIFMQCGPVRHQVSARAQAASRPFEHFVLVQPTLETLRETNGRFRINVALPIPFDGFGTLEVDLLCADARVAIELDGGQHLADPIAYRRDRRKDQLLQENGYFVLRFLAEDVGKELDAVLDAILRVLARRRQSAAKAEPLKFVRRGGD
jgi:hypothetical protein